MKSVQRENVSDGLPRREPQGLARFIDWCFGADVVHSMQASSWGRRLVGAPRSTLVIPDYSSLAQLKGSTPAPPQPSAPTGSAATPVQPPTQAADGDVLPKARGSARPSTIDLVAPAPTPAPDRAVNAPRATPTFDVEVDLPEAVFPARVQAHAPEPALDSTLVSAVSAAVPAIEAVPDAALDAAPDPEVDPAPGATLDPAGDHDLDPVLESLLARMLLSASLYAAAIPLAPPSPAPVPPPDASAPSQALLAQMLLSEMRFATAIQLATPEAEPQSPAEAASDAPAASVVTRRITPRLLGPDLLARADVQIHRAWLYPVPGVVLPPLVLVDAADTALSSVDADVINVNALPAGDVTEFADWAIAKAISSGDLPRSNSPARLAPYAFVVAAACILLAAIVVRFGSGATTSAATRAPGVSLATIEAGPTVIPSPTGLAASLSVVNPANLPTAAPTPPPAALALLAGAGAAVTDTLGSLFPFNIDIVTPTPNSVAEQMLFRDPLVAAEAPAGVDAEGAPDYQSPVVSLEQPVILRALESERNGGAAVAAASLDELARPRILPAMEVVKFPDIATPIPTAPPPPTAVPIALAPGRQWSSFTPSDASHFWVGRPHPAFVQNQIAAPSYQFGSTGGGRYRPHHGMDIANAFGTPVRAATTGEVVHAGMDDPDVLGPYPNFYGNAVVIKLDRRLSVAGGEMDVYLLYGHLSEVTIQKGQRVQPDDIVGMVGMTGIAIGPHLHVEMRVGANTYEASVNPYLWVEPPPGDGAVAVRLLTADGRTWPNARVTLARFEGNLATWARVLEAYPDNESINPDPSFGETTAMDAVPGGVYYLVAVVNGERVAAEVTVEAGKTTFVEMRTQQ